MKKIDQDSTRIGKLEDIITNLGSAFSAVKNTSNLPPAKVSKFIYVPKNKGESSSKENEDLKSIIFTPIFSILLRNLLPRMNFSIFGLVV